VLFADPDGVLRRLDGRFTHFARHRARNPNLGVMLAYNRASPVFTRARLPIVANHAGN